MIEHKKTSERKNNLLKRLTKNNNFSLYSLKALSYNVLDTYTESFILSYGFAGLFLKFFVNRSEMWWPEVLPLVKLLRFALAFELSSLFQLILCILLTW